MVFVRGFSVAVYTAAHASYFYTSFFVLRRTHAHEHGSRQVEAYRRMSAPFMLGILALQLLFEFRIGFTPEKCQVLGNLHRPVTWREHLNADANTVLGDPERVFNAVQILDARRNRRRAIDGVHDLHAAAAGQLNPLGRIFFYPSLLLPGKP